MRFHVRALAACSVVMAACGEPTGRGRRYDPPVHGYMVSTSARAVDPETGEQLMCNLSFLLRTGGPVGDGWSGQTRLQVVRARFRDASSAVFDTTITDHPVHAARVGRDSIRVILSGVIADTLMGREDPNYPHWFRGPWDCDARIPLSRVWSQPATGDWTAQPILPID